MNTTLDSGVSNVVDKLVVVLVAIRQRLRTLLWWWLCKWRDIYRVFDVLTRTDGFLWLSDRLNNVFNSLLMKWIGRTAR